jgi:hypothetical protein
VVWSGSEHRRGPWLAWLLRILTSAPRAESRTAAWRSRQKGFENRHGFRRERAETSQPPRRLAADAGGAIADPSQVGSQKFLVESPDAAGEIVARGLLVRLHGTTLPREARRGSSPRRDTPPRRTCTRICRGPMWRPFVTLTAVSCRMAVLTTPLMLAVL